MAEAVLRKFSRFLSVGKLTGPIFDKELRVSSRRRRNYVLRFVYLAALTLFVSLVWMSMVKFSSYGSNAYAVSRMSEAGKAIVMTIVWFEFIALQLIAVIMLSTSISDEINHKTLGTLMTTPISSFQIVMGKLLSKLWQLIILLAISIPILAIVRVFGGVPWEYLIAGVCITLSAMIFAGSVSMFFSIRTKRAYGVILKTMFVGGILFAFIPFLFTALMFGGSGSGGGSLLSLLLHTNPFAAMSATSVLMMTAGGGGAPFSFYWPVHCIVILVLSGGVLLLTIKSVRKVALRQATGDLNPFGKRKKLRPLPTTAATNVTPPPLPIISTAVTPGQAPPITAEMTAAPPIPAMPDDNPTGKIRRVVGSPVLWKELRAPLLKGGKTAAIIGIIAAIAALLLTYGVLASHDSLDNSETQIVYGVIFVIMGTICTAVLSATAITSEKEARSWPILLTTTQSDWSILWGKAMGVFRRCLPIWLFLAAHSILFTFVGYLHPIALLHLGLLVMWIVVFLTGTGLYFSSLCKRTTGAVVMNFGMALFLWAIFPILLGFASNISSSHNDDFFEAYFCANPVAQVVVIMEGAGGEYNAQKSIAKLDYDWPANDFDAPAATTQAMIIFTCIYITAGGLFAWLAKRRFRKKIF